MPDYSYLLGNDPLSIDDLLARQKGFLNQQQMNQAAGQKAQFSPLNPAEEQSTLGMLGNKALAGIGYVGGLLDKYTGGRAIRGVLGGNNRDLLSILPGSDVLGITDETKAVSGRDLGDQWGLTTKGSDDWTDTLIGMGLDIGTSPATYLTPGGLTKAGEAASKIGALPKGLGARIAGVGALDAGQAAKAASVGMTAADVVNQPLASLARFRIPFTEIGADLGTGAGAQAALKGAGDAASYLGHQTPLRHIVEPLQRAGHQVANYVRALFDSDVAGATTDLGQKAGRAFTADNAAKQAALRGTEASLIRETQGAGLLDKPDYLRSLGEGTIQAPGDAGNSIVHQIRGTLDSADAEGARLGFAPQKLQDSEIDYLPRHSTGLDVNSRGFGNGGKSPVYSTDPSALKARADEFRDIPGGTAKINELATDPELSGINGRYGPKGTQANGQAPTTPLQREAMVREKAFGWTAAEEQAAAQAQAKSSVGMALTPEEEKLVAQKAKSTDLARRLERLDPRHAETGQGIFANHVLDDSFSTASAKVRRNAAGNAIHDMIADAAVPADKAGPNYVRVDQALGQIGFTDPAAAQVQAQTRIGARLGGTPDVTGHYVPPEAINEAKRFLTPFQTPEVLQPLSNAIDWVTNLTKTAQTALFPGFHARNMFSGQFANAMMGAGDPRYSAANPLHYLAPIVDAGKLIKGDVIEGLSQAPIFAARGLSDAQATKELANMAYQYRVAGQGASRELAGTGEQVNQFLQKIPGMKPVDFVESAKSAVPRSWEQANPLNVAGVNANKDVFAPVKAAREIGGAVEDTNRLSGFIGLIRQGFHPEEAGAMARAAHVDYSALTPFERGVMKKVMPFYGYTKGIVPFTAKSVLADPGGLAGQTAMEAYHLQQQNGNDLIPDWMGQGLAIPLGKEENGNRRFLSKIDTPIEASTNLLGRDIKETGLNLLGMTNPLIKGPLELATGKQFFTGRDLGDLYPITGNTVVDQAIMNSPLSRFYTTARTLADPRKLADPAALGTNLLTGVRLNDVDMEKERDVQARALISDALRGQQGIGRYETIYPRQEMLGQLSPQDVALLRLNATLEQRAKVQADDRRKQSIGLPR